MIRRVFMGLVVVLVAGDIGMAAGKIKWAAYKSNLLNIQVSVPADWNAVKIPKALAFRYEDPAGYTAAIGFLKSDRSGLTIEQAADQEFDHAGSPANWTRSNAKVDGMRAIKLVGTDTKNPDQKIVHYYIETPSGNYLVQCQGTADQWPMFGPIFTTILNKLKFL